MEFSFSFKAKGPLIIALAVLGVLVWLGLSGHVSWIEVYEAVLRFLPLKKWQALSTSAYWGSKTG